MSGPDDTVGVIGLDVPLEVLDALGLRPRRVTADPHDPSPEAEPYGEGVGHPMLRALLATMLREGIGHVVIGASNPDHLALHNLLVSFERLGEGPAIRSTLFDLRRGAAVSGIRGGRDAVAGLLRKVAAAPIDLKSRLTTAIAERNALRAAQRSVEACRLGESPAMTGTHALALHRLADTLPPARATADLRAALDAGVENDSGGLPVIYSGSAACAARSYERLEASGLRVVGDDHDGGSRAIGPDCLGVDLLAALAERYRRRDPDPAIAPARDCTDYLVRMVEQRSARAVIFDIPSFDHAAAWDLPMKRAALEQRGIPFLVIAPRAYEAPDEHWRDVARQVLTLSKENHI